LRDYSEVPKFCIRVSRDTSENFCKVFRFGNSNLILSGRKKRQNQVNNSGSYNEMILDIPEIIKSCCHISFCFLLIRKRSNNFSYSEKVIFVSKKKIQLNYLSFLQRKISYFLSFYVQFVYYLSCTKRINYRVRNKHTKFYPIICLIFELHLKILTIEPGECRRSNLHIGQWCDHSTDDQIRRTQVIILSRSESSSWKEKLHGKSFISGIVYYIFINSICTRYNQN